MIREYGINLSREVGYNPDRPNVCRRHGSEGYGTTIITVLPELAEQPRTLQEIGPAEIGPDSRSSNRAPPLAQLRLDIYAGFHYIGGMADKPMTGQAFFVLTALADEPRHGYGIVGEVAELSSGRVRLKIGSLYGVLDRLAAEGLIEPDREEAHDGRLRRYYRLTRDGRGALAQEAELRAATARVVRVRLGLAGAEAAG